MNIEHPTSNAEHRTGNRLCVKELACALQVGKHFVYQMRACGFSMHGFMRNNQTASLKEAVDWIKAHDFRLVDGRGVIKSHK